MEGRDQAEPRGVGHLAKAHGPDGDGDDRADDDAQKHRDVGDKATPEAGDQQDGDQDDGGYRYVAQGRIGRVVQLGGKCEAWRDFGQSGGDGAFGDRFQPVGMGGVDDLRGGRADGVAEDPVDADAHQRHAENEDDSAGHHGRKEAEETRDKRRDQDRDQACCDDGPKDRAGAVGPGGGVGHRNHRANRREGHAHHHRQLDAEPLRGPQRLDQGDQTADEQVSRDQESHIRRFQFQRAPDDQGHSDSPGIHDQHMLQGEGEKLGRCENLVHRMG